MKPDTLHKHPAPFSESVIAWLRDNLRALVPVDGTVHDPFAGDGVRLGALCDLLGIEFSGVDLEPWLGRDERVSVGDSRDPHTYPRRRLVIVTSPTYNNGVNDHFNPRETSRRLTYRVAAGRPLDNANTGRWSGRSSAKAERTYWNITRAVVACWSLMQASPVIVNLKDSTRKGEPYPLTRKFADVLREAGYRIERHEAVPVAGWRLGTNRESRDLAESIIVATLEPQPGYVLPHVEREVATV